MIDLNNDSKNKFIYKIKKLKKHLLKQTENTKMLHRLIEGLGKNYCLFSHTPDGFFTYASSGFEAVWGIEAKNIIGKNWRELNILEEDLKKGEKTDKKILNSKNIETVQLKYNHPSGKIKTIEIVYGPAIENNKIIALEGICIDITKTIENMRLLDEKKQQLNRIIDNIPGAVYMCKNDKNWTMTFISENFFYLTGYHTKELINNNSIAYSDLIIKEDQNYVWKKIQKALKQKKTYLIEYRIITKNKKIKWIWEKGRGIYNKNNELLYLEGILIDITERHKLQNQLIQSEKLSTAGQLAAGIAHEFNNLLAIVSINKQFILSADSKRMSPDSIESLKNIDESIQRGKKIVENMMAFAKPLEPKKEITQIKNIIEEVLKIQSLQLELEQIEIIKDYSSGSEVVSIDRNQFEQVFINLFINARQAIKPNGKGIIKISILKEKNFIIIKFFDNGIGMSEETKKKLFNPFYSTKGAHAKDNLKIKGTGLGLSITYQIIKQHNGTISVKSTKKKGSTFIITLPILNSKN